MSDTDFFRRKLFWSKINFRRKKFRRKKSVSNEQASQCSREMNQRKNNKNIPLEGGKVKEVRIL